MLAHFAEVRRRKSLRSRVKDERGADAREYNLFTQQKKVSTKDTFSLYMQNALRTYLSTCLCLELALEVCHSLLDSLLVKGLIFILKSEAQGV